MKILCSTVLIGALTLLAPALSAQRATSYTYGGISASYNRGVPSYTRDYSASRVWVPGHFENVSRRVYVPGPVRREWVEPFFEWRFDLCGARFVCVRDGYWRTVQLPGHYEVRCERVWRPGSWVTRGCR